MRRLLRFVAFGYCLQSCLHSTLLHAQSSEDLRYLLFDAVPISVSTAADGTVQVTELATLPATAPLTLEQWLRTSNAEAPQTTAAVVLPTPQGSAEADIAASLLEDALPQQDWQHRPRACPVRARGRCL